MNSQFLESLFKFLAGNLCFPYYQEERRIDIFINFFLEQIIRKYAKPFTDAEYVLAEFPLRKNNKTDHSAHIDYLVVSKKEKKILFVELKTDEQYFKIDQIEFYEKYSKFTDWYEKFDKIKMNGFKPKKDFAKKIILKKIGANLDKYDIAIIIIKPNPPSKEHEKEGRYFISLKEVVLESDYSQEWELLRQIVLLKLPEKNFTQNDCIVED